MGAPTGSHHKTQPCATRLFTSRFVQEFIRVNNWWVSTLALFLHPDDAAPRQLQDLLLKLDHVAKQTSDVYMSRLSFASEGQYTACHACHDHCLLDLKFWCMIDCLTCAVAVGGCIARQALCC